MTVTPQPTGAPARPAPSTSPASSSAPAVAAKAAEPSIGQLVSDASTHISTIIQGEIELAKLELKSSVKNAGVGVVLFLGAAVVFIFSLTFGFIALAEGLAAIGLSRWLSFLIVFGFLVLLAVLFVLIGIRLVKKVKAPEKTIRTGKETVDYLKNSRA